MAKQFVQWRPHAGPQITFLSNPAYECLYGGARGGGKTDCVLFGALRQIAKKNYRALILRRTFPELREVMDRAALVFPSCGGKLRAAENRWIFPSGAKIEFGYCETLSDVSQYLGQQFQHIAFDEIGMVPEEKIWLMLLTCLRGTDPSVDKNARCSANPGGAGHGWVKKRFIVPCPPDGTPILTESGRTRAFVQARIYDNPSIMENDPEYVKNLQELPDVLRKQHLEGDWDVGTGLAFESLTEHSHSREREPEPYWTYYGAFDWGFGHKWYFGIFANLPGGRVYLLDTATGRRQIPEEIVQRVADCLGGWGLRFSDLRYTVAGSDLKHTEGARGNAGPTIAEQFLMAGWPTIKADQNRPGGYQNTLKYLHKRAVMDRGKVIRESMLEFNPTPTTIAGIQDMQTLVVDPDSPNDVLKRDADDLTGQNGDDFYDMVRYGLMSRPIASIAPVVHEENRDLSKVRGAKILHIEKRQSENRGWNFTNPRLLTNKSITP